MKSAKKSETAIEAMLWTFDHRMMWADPDGVALAAGRRAPYLGSANDFFDNYSKLIDFASSADIKKIIAHGLVRLGAERERMINKLLQYAGSRGVVVMPVIAMNEGGGFASDANHRYNLAAFLSTHGDAKLTPSEKQANGTAATLAICPIKTKSQAWLAQGTDWLLRTYEPQAIYVDFFGLPVCHCSACVTNRQGLDGSDDYFKDMATIIGPIIATAQKKNKAVEIFCATGRGIEEATEGRLLPLGYYHEQLRLEWLLTPALEKGWPEDLSLDVGRHGGCLHHGSSEKDLILGRQGEFRLCRQQCVLQEIESACQFANQVGLTSLSLSGEMGNTSVANELNYLTLAAYCEDSQLATSNFADRYLAPHYGPSETSQQFLRYLKEGSTLKREILKSGGPDEKRYLVNEAKSLVEAVEKVALSASGDWQGRWSWLLSETLAITY